MAIHHTIMAETNGPPPTKKPHVGIIGAGISGLRCAGVLLQQGFQVTLLEARSRIGGRICQSDKLGYNVDLGPNWIHASDNPEHQNPIFQTANKTGTPLHEWNDKQRIFNTSGEKIRDETTDRLSTILWAVIEEAFSLSLKSREGNEIAIPKDESLYDYIKREAPKRVSSEDETTTLLKMSEMFGAYVGEPVWKQSLRFAWMEECCGGDEVFVASNYSAILSDIARPVLDHAKVKLDTYIASVSTPNSRVPDGHVTLTSRHGVSIKFDEVVVTTPLGWLKRNQDVFSPPLPPPLSSAIENISLSQLEKVFITFPSVFWGSNSQSDVLPHYTNWLRPSYALDTNPEGWPQEIWDLSSFAPPNSHPTILFYTYGDCSRHIVNTIDELSADEEFRFLDDFFRPYYSRLPGYDASEPSCRPKAILASKWQKDDLSGNGSYCNFQVGMESADKDVIAFRDGCPDRRLWFCGEHAAPFEECGTVAGAYLSGESAAKKIIEIYDR